MKIYVSDSNNNKALVKLAKELDVGHMVSPKYYRNKQEVFWALDNGAYRAFSKGIEFDHTLFLNTVNKAVKAERKPDFIVLPDIVGGGNESFTLSMEYIDIIDSSLKKYLVIQSRMTNLEEKLNTDIDGIFIGGIQFWEQNKISNVFKLADRYGLCKHIGRIGTLKKYLWADSIGADSVDGSNPSRNNRMNIISEYRGQSTLSTYSYYL